MFYTAHKFPRRGRWVRGWARFPGTRRLYSLPGWIQRPGLELIGPASSWLEMLSGRLRSHQRSPSVSWLRVCVLPLLHPFPTHSECVLSIVELSFLLSLSLSLSLCLSVSISLCHSPTSLRVYIYFVSLSFSRLCRMSDLIAGFYHLSGKIVSRDDKVLKVFKVKVEFRSTV